MVMKKPGERWRVLAHADQRKVEVENDGIFDELVVDDWLHIEQMDENAWWIRIGDARIDVRLVEGVAEVDIERGFYADVQGTTRVR
jgi:hypothetical protein